ncbi:MAG TPA: universal stress protein, partial [Thauera sp.]|nr:universal stress protein [Thauera sp.]
MNKQDRKVLACVDQSHFADTVADYAAWAARRMDAPLELLHVIDRHLEQGSGDDHSGAIGFNAQEHLLHSLSDKDAALARSKREQGRIFLNHLRERALAAGAPSADMRQRHGALDDTLAEQEDNVRLFVFGRRGASAAKTRPEGSNTLGR